MTKAPQICVIEARFYGDIADAPYEGAHAVLEGASAEITRLAVPGVLEIPAALAMALARGFDGYVLLGCVIRGETSHYDIVANDSARAIMDLSVQHKLALGNGVLTVENGDQAWARARRSQKDKGGDAARAALAMIDLRARLQD